MASINAKKAKRAINIVSILIPIVVAVLFGVRIPDVEPLSFLPPIYATINGVTAVLLLAALWAIKNGKRSLHNTLMNVAIACSLAFLVMYVAYHMTSDSTPYGGEGIMCGVYFFILISHIVLSIVVIPFVLHTYLRGFLGAYQEHKKLARYTFPIWLYVAVTGVVVYLMISPYYAH
jgi:putative membrane protein